MKTAVEWLAEKYEYVTWLRNRDEISPKRADDLRDHFLKQAKEMERQQIIDAHLDGQSLVSCKDEYAEQYYTETFNKK